MVKQPRKHSEELSKRVEKVFEELEIKSVKEVEGIIEKLNEKYNLKEKSV